MKKLLALALLLALCLPAIAQVGLPWPGPGTVHSAAGPSPISFVNGADLGNNGGSGTLTTAYTVTSGSNILVIAVVGDVVPGNDDITGVTYNSASATLCNKIVNVTNQNRQWYLYYLFGPTAGAHNVVVTSTNSHYLLAGVTEYAGGSGTDVTTTNTGPPSVLTTSFTTTNNNAWMMLMLGKPSGTDPFANSSGTITPIRRVWDTSFQTWGLFDSNFAITPAGANSMATSSEVTPMSGHILCGFKP